MGPGRLFQGARDTRKCEIVRAGGAIGNTWPDVIDVKNGLLRNLWKPAVFANITRAIPHQLRQLGRSGLAHFLCFLAASFARNRISEKTSTSFARAVASRRSRGDNLPVRSCRSSNSWSRSCRAAGKLNFRQSFGKSSSMSTVMNVSNDRVGIRSQAIPILSGYSLPFSTGIYLFLRVPSLLCEFSCFVTGDFATFTRDLAVFPQP